MDYALLQRLIQVFDKQGNQIEGLVSLQSQESQWVFTPETYWKPGDYIIRVNTLLEDLAGNSLRRLFDVDIKTDQAYYTEDEYIELRFSIQETNLEK